MTYKKTTLILLTWLLVGSNLAAQTTDTDKPKWEVGTDLLWLINKNTLPDYTIFSRWHYKSNRAIRLRIGTDIRTDPLNQSRGVERANIMARLGHEWSKGIGIKTDLIWGVESNYQKNEIFPYLLPPLPNPPFYFPSYSWQLGGVAFVGCQYFISHNFSLSIESNFKIFYKEYGLNNYSFGTILITPDNLIFDTAGKLQSILQTPLSGIISEIQTLQVFNISYHF